ncbi:MAG: rRNA (cytidine1920-2-O)/16S rRNA (cytidine1409-2-O)-methyltransferase [Acidimicrobiaceae bacterium]|nr:rRNA (cytidine1920-2-O)/16S rRNA (cytidine1409-2-O)-methyltransferase [Acidimicrobiaceae bacterium]
MKLIEELRRVRPDLQDPTAAIAAGHVLVDGRHVTNPASQVPTGCSLVVKADAPLRGEAKLRAALTAFEVDVAGRVALDAGAAAGGFTRVLLEAGAARVYAVDVGHGQLVGSLRQNARVVNLEGTNLADLDRASVPDPVEVITLDLSYLSLAEAVPQIRSAVLAPAVDLVVLVKPMFELHLDHAPIDAGSLEAAVEAATKGAETAGWTVEAAMESPVRGSRGAREALLHARRTPRPC